MSKVLCICGRKNSGKTTYIRKLVKLIKASGHTVAVIKHDGHSFEADVPETDSYAFYHDGADAVAVFDSEHCLMHMRREADYAFLLRQFADMDIVLIEGAKESAYRKAEIIRQDTFEPVSDPANRIGIITDRPEAFRGRTDEPLYDLNAPETLLADFLRLSDCSPAPAAVPYSDSPIGTDPVLKEN